MGEEIELPRRRLGKTDIELTVFGVGGYLGLLVDKQASKADGEQGRWRASGDFGGAASVGVGRGLF